jgi:hypothetical protein
LLLYVTRCSLSTPALTTYFAMDDGRLFIKRHRTFFVSCDRYYYYSKNNAWSGRRSPLFIRSRPFHGPGGEWSGVGGEGAHHSLKRNSGRRSRLLNLGHLHGFSSLRGRDRRRFLDGAVAVGAFARPRPYKPVHGNSDPVALRHPLLGACELKEDTINYEF